MKLKWDQIGERVYETGVDHGVLYPQKGGAYPKGVTWNGLITVTQSPSGAEDNAFYADNVKYFSLKSAEEFGATIECYTYPDEWAACNGEATPAKGVIISQQRRNTFGLSYRTKVGNDTDGEDYGFKIHIIYGGSAAPSEKPYTTVNDSPEPITFSYEITTTPVPVSGKDETGKPFKPVAHLEIDSRYADPEKLAEVEAILYGTDAPASGLSTYAEGDGVEDGGTATGTEPRLPLPDEIIALFADTTPVG